MKKIQRPADLTAALKKLACKGKTIGFVPTMGALHEGHLALVRASRRENDVTVVSIFVNPMQFGPKEDFSKYPRVMASDAALLKKEKVDFIFAPSPEDIYPKGYATIVEICPKQTDKLCGKYRPGHFRGVTTVVAKLFNIVQADKVYFGAKDYQQAMIIKQMVRDLRFGCEFRLMPTVREKDGLAMSSRNRYLTPEERKRSLAISQALFYVKREILAGRGSLARLKAEAVRRMKAAGLKVQYFEIVDAETLEAQASRRGKLAALAACFAGKTRLIDNVIIPAPGDRKK